MYRIIEYFSQLYYQKVIYTYTGHYPVISTYTKMPNKSRCIATTATGRRCTKKPIDGHDFCACHIVNNVPKPLDLELSDHDEPETILERAINVPLPSAPEIDELKSIDNLQALFQDLKIVKDQIEKRDEQLESLKTQLDIIISTTRLQQQSQRKPRAPKQPSIEKRAKRYFYHENKKRPDIINTIADRLRAVDMFISEKDIPWQLVRAATDSIFNMLSTEEKNAYAMRASQVI